MSPGTGFVAFFALTLGLLALVVVSGLRARRRVHIALVILSLGALALTIHYAYGVGTIYDIHRAGWITPLHLTLARVCTVSFLLPIASGIRTIFVPRTRRLHRWLAFGVLGLTVLTAATGGIMLWCSPLRAP